MEEKEESRLVTLMNSLMSLSELKDSSLTAHQLQFVIKDVAIHLSEISNSLNRQMKQKDREIQDLKKQLSQKDTQIADLKRDNEKLKSNDTINQNLQKQLEQKDTQIAKLKKDDEKLKDDITMNQIEKIIDSIEKAEKLCKSMLDKGVELNLITVSDGRIICGEKNRTLSDLFNSDNAGDRKKFYSMYDDLKKLDEIYSPIESFLSKFGKSYLNVLYPELYGSSSDYNHLIKGDDEDEIGAISRLAEAEDGVGDNARSTESFYDCIAEFSNKTLSLCKKRLVNYKEKLQKNNVKAENNSKFNNNNFNNKGEKEKEKDL